VADEVERARVAPLDLLERLLPLGRVAAEREDVAQAGLFGGLEGLVDLVRGHVGAREVHHRLDADEVLHLGGQVERHVGRRAARAPRDVAKGRAAGGHAVEALEEVVDALLGARGEELEAEEGAALGLGRADLVDDLHFLLCFCFRAALSGGRAGGRAAAAARRSPSFCVPPAWLELARHKQRAELLGEYVAVGVFERGVGGGGGGGGREA
jgi:hypothetical protein